MKCTGSFGLILVSCMSTLVLTAGEPGPLSLHPDNPHYFLFRDRPTVLITSAEHYGAVLNLDFDYARYLEALAAAGMNLTRTFSGAYVEPKGAFNIASNTLAPERGRFICPWARSNQKGYKGGGNKFDLDRWDEDYFKRLRDFVATASKHGIVVEYVFFCPFYKDQQWQLSPQYARNNINGVGRTTRKNVYTLDHRTGLLPVHKKLVHKVVKELADFDNLYYEICNEPYFGGVTMAWQHAIADTIVAAEKSLRAKHLISINVANGRKKVEKPHPAISIFNFHYATPPDTVDMNYALGKVIGDNETGFRGTGNRHYRMEGWEFILAGGGLYNNLDYSFTAGHEDGTYKYPPKQPGGGNVMLRRQLRYLRDFIHGFDFIRMRPEQTIIKSRLPEKVRGRVLAERGRQYALYFTGGGKLDLKLDIPGGTYSIQWHDPMTMKSSVKVTRRHRGGPLELSSPEFKEDMALAIVRD